ncbi:helix-turn-helix transcriptional regulator [Methanocaldococcus sp.]|uniref:ArsR/SmtB family transcription factor n=1 Tax=Methanocaldococcus sp. TaxID=2152917 RepID=UPI0026077123|nr:helix-turn-helix domain-containing protein [Methanocaldococcus sp.]MCQ6254735.1 helix-turn-helix domain-containing protein [Methanocaldococcus sp.]
MDEVSERILLYLSQVGKATNKEIAEAFNINPGLISKKLQYLQDNGLIKVVEQEGRTKYYALAKPHSSNENEIPHIQIPKDIDTITGINSYIKKVLKEYNWHSTSYSIPITALLISKYTNLRLIIFGPQYVGKTTCIKAVYPDLENNPKILVDMHRKDMYQYIDMVKDNIKIIEQQYLHDWRFEDTKIFDRYDVVPKSRIAPSEFLFRFLPLRIKMPSEFDNDFKFFTLDLDDFKIIKTIPKDIKDKFIEKLNHLKFFTIDVGACRTYLEILKEKEIANLYHVDREGNMDQQLSARQWRIEREYSAVLKNDFLTVNHRKLKGINELWQPVSMDNGLLHHAFEILKFSYSLNKNPDVAVDDAYRFMKYILKTFTLVKEDSSKNNVSYPTRNVESGEGVFSIPTVGSSYFIPANKMVIP